MMRIATLSAVLLIAMSAAAQQRRISASVTMSLSATEMQVGQLVRLEVRADVQGGDIDRFSLPDLSAFEVVSQQEQRPVSIRFGSGNQPIVQTSTTVRRFVLRAVQPGRFELPAAEIEAGGETFRSQPLTLEVIGDAPAGTSPRAGAGAGTTQDDDTLESGEVDSTAFIRTILKPARPYVGQQTTVSVYLYTRGAIRSRPAVTQEPSADGFWVQDLLDPGRLLEPRREVVNGQVYRAYLFKQFAAFPLQSGELSIGPTTIQFSLGSTFDLFQGGRQLTRTGVPLAVEARPPPTPPGGASADDAIVGEYTVRTSLDRAQVRTGDAITLRAEVRGKGNVRNADLTLPEIDGVRALAPQVDDRVEHTNGLVHGERHFEWLLVPEQPGEHTIPALELLVFDPRTETFERVGSAPLTFTAAGNAITPPPSDDLVDPDETQAESDPTPPANPLGDLPPLHTRSDLRRVQQPVSSHAWYLGVLFAIPLAFLMALGLVRLRRRSGSRRSAERTVQKGLGRAQSLARDGDPRAFYGVVAQTLQASIEDRLGEPVGGMTHDTLRHALRRLGMEEDLLRRVIEELESCDFARFSSAGGSQDEMRRCLDRTRALMTRIARFRPEAA